MKKMYPVYLILSISIFALGIFFAKGDFLIFIDPPSALLVFGPLILMLLTSYSPSEIIDSFKAAMKENTPSRVEIKNALLLFETAQSLIYKIAFLATLFGVVLMLSAKWTIENFGWGLSVASLSVVYALVTVFLVIIPFKMALQKKINSLDG